MSIDPFKSLFSIAFLSILLFSTPSPINTSSDWKLARSKKGIKVYTRFIPGHQLKQYKCEMISPAPIELLSEILKAYNKHANWGEGISESAILNQSGEDDFHVYFYTPLPWPVSDRDIVTHFQWENWDDGTINIKMSAKPDWIPHKDGAVRITFFNGYWRLKKMDDGRVLVSTLGHLDPGGYIPDWLANTGVVNGPYDTMIRLRERAALGF